MTKIHAAFGTPGVDFTTSTQRFHSVFSSESVAAGGSAGSVVDRADSGGGCEGRSRFTLTLVRMSGVARIRWSFGMKRTSVLTSNERVVKTFASSSAKFVCSRKSRTSRATARYNPFLVSSSWESKTLQRFFRKLEVGHQIADVLGALGQLFVAGFQYAPNDLGDQSL
ncbi:MAG: hypothetical protein QM756_30035 [Polyangiaceae bacterium]